MKLMEVLINQFLCQGKIDFILQHYGQDKYERNVRKIMSQCKQS